MTVRGLRRIIVSVAELDPALALYRDALGFAEQYRSGDVVMLAVPGGDLELLLHRRQPTPGLAGVAAGLLVDDVDAMTAAAEKAGATVVEGPADQPWGERQSVLLDPDGHVLCLVSPTKGPDNLTKGTADPGKGPSGPGKGPANPGKGLADPGKGLANPGKGSAKG